MGKITAAERDASVVNLEDDIAAGVFSEVAPEWQAVFARAEALAAAHASTNLCRTLDTLHVALALELGATEFCSFDLRQAAMAGAAHLAVVP